ncbi:regulator of G protein signaling domain-containing protein [Phthorimaea operculella]|nr:regulator of G protein signaling domain-containing protein [Phthorimaea operculella]
MMKLLRVDLELVMQDQEHFYAFMQHLKTTSHIHLLQFYKDIMGLKLVRVDLELVMQDQEHFYAFMQHLKTTSHIHLLQFYKDIKSLQTKILNPELEPTELAYLHTEACDMYARYFADNNLSLPSAMQPLAEELKELLKLPPESVKKLQTSRALYQAARHSHAELEKIMLPKFLHSEEYYRLLLGSRIPTGFQKHMARKPQERLIHTALRLGNRLRGALKTQNIDGQVLDCFTNSDVSDGDSIENMDILQYLDSIADDTREQDLSTCKVVLTNVETRLGGSTEQESSGNKSTFYLQAPPRRGSVRVFTVAVHRLSPSGARLFTVERSEHDFHLLRSKLHEFHGDLLQDLQLPSRRYKAAIKTELRWFTTTAAMIGREDREDALLKSALQADERVRVVSEHLTECLHVLEEAPTLKIRSWLRAISQCLSWHRTLRRQLRTYLGDVTERKSHSVVKWDRITGASSACYGSSPCRRLRRLAGV